MRLARSVLHDPIRTELKTEISLWFQLRVVAGYPFRRDEQIGHLWSPVTCRYARMKLPRGLRLIEQRDLWRDIEKGPVGPDFGRRWCGARRIGEIGL